MEQSNVILDFFSTASIEAFGWGKKILHCDFTNSNKYNDYDPMIMFTEPDFNAFEKRLDKLRSESNLDYLKRTKQYAQFLMNYHHNNSPHTFINNKIKEFI